MLKSVRLKLDSARLLIYCVPEVIKKTPKEHYGGYNSSFVVSYLTFISTTTIIEVIKSKHEFLVRFIICTLKFRD